MKEAAEKLGLALTIYMQSAGLEQDETFLKLFTRLKSIASSSSPNPKEFAEVCLGIFQAVQNKKDYKNFIDLFRGFLERYVPDQLLRMRILSEIRIFRDKNPQAKDFAVGIEALLWTESDVEKEYQDIKETLRQAKAVKLIALLDEKFAEYKQAAKENSAAVESSAVRKLKSGRPSRKIELDSKGFEIAPEKAVMPKKAKTQKAKETVKAFKEIESEETSRVSKATETQSTVRVSKETEETKVSRQKATMSRESETREITENPHKQQFREELLKVCSKFIRQTGNTRHKESFAKIAERVTTSPIPESARKLFEEIKKEAWEKIQSPSLRKEFVAELEKNYENYRRASGEIAQEKAQKEAELKAQKEAKWAELEARVEAKRKKYAEKEKGKKREPTETEIRIGQEVHKQREDVELLRDAIGKERAKPESEREESALKELEARFAEAEKNLIKLETQLVVASGVLQETTPKTMKILAKREEAEALDATLKGSLEKLKAELDQWQEERTKQKASVPQHVEEVEKALGEMRRNLENPPVVQREESMDMGEVAPLDVAHLAGRKDNEEARDEDLLRKSQESMRGYEEAKSKANIPLMREQKELLKLVAEELLQKREVLSQRTGLSEEDIETKVEAVANRGGHESLAQSLAKKGWDVLPAVFSDFIAVRVFGLLPYNERVAEIKQHCVSAECNLALHEMTTQREKYNKEYGDEYVTRNLLEGKFDNTIKNGVPAKFVSMLQAHLKREEGAEKILESLKQRGAELERVKQPPLAEKQARKRPFGVMSLKVRLPAKRVKKEESPVDLDEFDRRMDRMAEEEKEHQIEMRTVPVKKSSAVYSQELKNELSGDAAEKFIEQVKEGLDYKLMTVLGVGTQKVIDAYDKYRTAKTEDEKSKVIKEVLGNKVVGRREAKIAIEQYFAKRLQLNVLYHDFKLGNVSSAQRDALKGLEGHLKGVDNLDRLHSFARLMDADAAKNADKGFSTVPPPGHH